ncbi:hypothetical protein Tco_1511999 [Tanacetum coccineum]
MSFFLAMTTPTPRRYRWEIVYPTGPKRWICLKNGWRMIHIAYRCHVLVETSPVQVREKSPKRASKVGLEEDPEEDPEEDLEEKEEED